MTNIWFVILCSHGIQHSISVLAQNLIRDLSFDGMEQNWFLVFVRRGCSYNYWQPIFGKVGSFHRFRYFNEMCIFIFQTIFMVNFSLLTLPFFSLLSFFSSALPVEASVVKEILMSSNFSFPFLRKLVEAF